MHFVYSWYGLWSCRVLQWLCDYKVKEHPPRLHVASYLNKQTFINAVESHDKKMKQWLKCHTVLCVWECRRFGTEIWRLSGVNARAVVWFRRNLLPLSSRKFYVRRCLLRISAVTPVILKDSRCFPQSLQENTGRVSRIRHNCFLPNSFQINIHQSCSHCCRPGTP
jgi:hypothetical protein